MNSVNHEGKSAIMLPMQPFLDNIYNVHQIVKILLEWEADINQVDNQKRSVLHYVAKNITNDKGIIAC